MHNWQLHYMHTMTSEYSSRPDIQHLEMDCEEFTGYDSDNGIDLVLFYFAGTRGFQIGLDGEIRLLSDVSTEDAFATEVSSIGPYYADAWEEFYTDGEPVGDFSSVCMFVEKEGVEHKTIKPWD